MRKGSFVSVIALLVSIVGLLVALAAYFKNRSCSLCDDLESDLVEYYDNSDCDGCCDCDCDLADADVASADAEQLNEAPATVEAE